MGKHKHNNAPAAKIVRHAPDWSLENEIDGISDVRRINAHAPQYRFKAREVPLSTFDPEFPLLASDEMNPEAMFMAREEGEGSLTIVDLEEDLGVVARITRHESFPPHIQAQLPILNDSKPKKHKKLIPRHGVTQPVQEVTSEYPDMPDIPTTCFAGNNLVPIGPRDLHGEICRKEERASGIRKQELFLSTRCCCGKKNPNFRRIRLQIIRDKKRGLAA